MNNSSAGTHTYSPTPDNVKYLGRFYYAREALWLTYSGGGIEFTCSADQCRILLKGGLMTVSHEETHLARYAVFVNGIQVIDELLTSEEQTVTIPCPKDGTSASAGAASATGSYSSVIRLVKLSETTDSSLGITAIVTEDGEIAPTAEKPLKIEFIGDSITCGYGVDAALGNIYSTANENVTKSYAYQTAQLLAADYSMVSVSGYGIVSGYTSDGTIHSEQILPDYYEKLGFSYEPFDGTVYPQSLVWDFTLFVPDIIVVNLGTNDASYCKDAKKRALYRKRYLEFLHTIRHHNPKADIVCTLGVMGTELNASVEAVTESFRSAGDTNIYYLPLPEQHPEDGYVVDYHPSRLTHQKTAEYVAAFLKNIQGR